ncbi:MAG: hypothetical protein EOP48_15105 [Sphingobacteriales bacterium]|nr:MAG: hypothetical protein EOP48_15105 [Sphingobacteriales bacterium]
MAIRYFILILIACLNSYTSSAQEKQIHSGQLYKLRTKQFVSFDTSSSLIRIGQTGLANIEMIFYNWE